ncbi:MAG TPA: hypothetical protein PKA05_09485 [Roseiflexaceae bacterium]|nr:hypothetical protein [Roseiflexaceae bacterium]HMP40599.1 hypothetical protein [Roseiflexaceae bacterium]
MSFVLKDLHGFNSESCRSRTPVVGGERLEELNEELERLNGEARELEERIAVNVAALLERSAVADA